MVNPMYKYRRATRLSIRKFRASAYKSKLQMLQNCCFRSFLDIYFSFFVVLNFEYFRS